MRRPLGISILSYFFLIVPPFLFLINLPFRGFMPLDMVMTIVLCIIIGYGLRRNRYWARPLLMVFWLLVIHEHLGNDRFYSSDRALPSINNLTDLRTLIIYIVLALLTYWYLYRTHSLKEYYDDLLR